MDRPIRFTTDEIIALLNGRKTQHRVMVKPQPSYRQDDASIPLHFADGDRLWAREVWATGYHGDAFPIGCGLPISPDGRPVFYYAQEKPQANAGYSWRASIGMPRWASRITLLVTAVRTTAAPPTTSCRSACAGMIPANARPLGHGTRTPWWPSCRFR